MAASGLQRMIMREIIAKVLQQAADQLEQQHPDQTTAIEWLRSKAAEAAKR